MIRSDDVSAIIPALVGALGEMEDIVKTRTAKIPTKSGSEYKYTFADLADLLGYVRPKLAIAGLAVTQTAMTDEKGTCVSTTILHISGQWLEFEPLRLPAGVDAQSHGSSITFARRYSLMAALGLATEDDDGAAASKAPTRQAAAKPAPPRPANVAPTGEVMATEAQVQKIQIAMKGHGDRDAKLHWLGEFVGRTLASSKELTRAEASAVIDHLEAEATR